MEMFRVETLFYIRVETTTSLTHPQTKKRQEKKSIKSKNINFYTQHCKKNAILIPYFPQKNSIEITLSFKSFL